MNSRLLVGSVQLCSCLLQAALASKQPREVLTVHDELLQICAVFILCTASMQCAYLRFFLAFNLPWTLHSNPAPRMM